MGNPAQNTWYIIDEHCAMLSFGDTFMVTFMWLKRYLLVSIHHMCCRGFDPENPLYPLRSSVGFLVHYLLVLLRLIVMFCSHLVATVSSFLSYALCVSALQMQMLL